MGRNNNKSGRELQSIQENLEYSGEQLKAFLIDIMPKNTSNHLSELEYRMIELESLVDTFGGIEIFEKIQKRGDIDYKFYIGSGKLDEIIVKMKELGANLLIFGNTLKRHQIYNVNERLRTIGAKAWDRIDLILKIFEKNALSAESKLQIELASIKHMGPRIYGMGMELSKQGGGKGSKGQGETNTEIMKRHLRERELTIKEELEKYKKVRELHRKGRKRSGLSTIGIVGYTNAGKSSLLNSLTSKGVLQEDKLFATLGTSVGKLWLNTEDGRGREILLNDTIGFIRDLPPNLIKAFSSTLEDSIESDLIFHVIDASDPRIDEKMKVVEDILNEIGAVQKRIYIFNKIDLLGSEEELQNLRDKYNYLRPIFISTFEKTGFDELKAFIANIL